MFSCLSSHLILSSHFISFNFSHVDSLRQSDAYMRRKTWSSLAQIMPCRLFGAKPLYETLLDNSKWNILEYIGSDTGRETSTSIQDEFENVVCKMGAILSRPKCVSRRHLKHNKTLCIELNLVYNYWDIMYMPRIRNMQLQLKLFPKFQSNLFHSHWSCIDKYVLLHAVYCTIMNRVIA